MATAPRELTRSYFLGKLARELEQRGFAVDLRLERPSLKVSAPEAALLNETVDCVSLEGGWFYRWSWGEVVESADDPDAAATLIAKVLGTR